MRVLRAFLSHFMGVGLPDTQGSSDFQGNLASLLGSHPVSSVFVLAVLGLACFDPHLMLDPLWLQEDEVARGDPLPTAQGQGQVEQKALRSLQCSGEMLWSLNTLKHK